MKITEVDLYQHFGRKREGNGGVLTCYIAEPITELAPKRHPAMVIFPGGGYRFISQREAEPVALRFLNEGFNAFVLRYSVDTEFPVPLIEGAMAVSYVRSNADMLNISADNICVAGFSAGGHLAGMTGTLFGYAEEQGVSQCRPDAVALCYPVISSDDRIQHKGSFDVLCGEDDELRRKLSLEKAVRKDSSPAFIWHTCEDNAVPVSNSILMAQAYAENKVPFELHIFEKGGHGLSIASRQTEDFESGKWNQPDASVWTDLLTSWLLQRGFSVKPM